MHLYILYFLSQFSWVVPDPAVPLVLPLRFLVPLVLSLLSLCPNSPDSENCFDVTVNGCWA